MIGDVCLAVRNIMCVVEDEGIPNGSIVLIVGARIRTSAVDRIAIVTASGVRTVLLWKHENLRSLGLEKMK